MPPVKTSKINTTEQGCVRANDFAHGSGKNIQCEGGAGIVGSNPLFQRLHIALTGREREEATLVVKQIFEFIGTEFLIAQKVEEDAGIEIAGTRPHRDAAGGGESHSGVDG